VQSIQCNFSLFNTIPVLEHAVKGYQKFSKHPLLAKITMEVPPSIYPTSLLVTLLFPGMNQDLKGWRSMRIADGP
jgi:hypothetical protein